MPTNYDFKANGFDVWATGGGCTAYGKNISGGQYILITDEGGSSLPDSTTMLVGVLDSNGDELSCRVVDMDHLADYINDIVNNLPH